MKIEKQLIKLPEGYFDVKIQAFEESDRKILFDAYVDWRKLCTHLLNLTSRLVNLPEGISEGAFCLEMNAVRILGNIPNANSSFDCYFLEKKERIQVKACSIIPDLTSFGPKSVWDKLYFLDFYRKGKWDGTFDIYLINNKDIYNHYVNADQTFCDQQEQGRRPRFSIFREIIRIKNIKPVKTGNLKVD